MTQRLSVRGGLVLVSLLVLGVAQVVWSGGSSPVSWAGGTSLVGDPAARSSRSESSVAIDPTNPDRVIVATMDVAATPRVRVVRSTDGGVTWQEGGFVPMSRPPFAGACTPLFSADPVAHFDARGVAYVTYLAYLCADQGIDKDNIYVVRSEDGGATWSAPMSAHYGGTPEPLAQNRCIGTDKEWFTSDPATGALHLTWVGLIKNDCAIPRGDPLADGLLAPGPGAPIWHRSSTDGGNTWSAATRVSGSDKDLPQAPMPVVLPDGSVVITYINSKPVTGVEDVRCPSVAQTVNGVLLTGDPPRVSWIEAARSTDNGATWTRSVVATVCDAFLGSHDHPDESQNIITIPVNTYDPVTRTLVVVWTERDIPTPVVHVARSTDGGLSWTSAGTVGEPGHGNSLPALAADDGLVHLIYTASLNAGVYEVFHRWSDDGGATWSAATRLSDAVQCTCLGHHDTFFSPHYAFIGHYNTVAAAGGKVIPVWTSAHSPSGPQDIVTRIGRTT